MKDKLIGWGFIGLSTALLLWNWDKYADIYYTFNERPVYFRISDYVTPVVHGVMYLLIFYTSLRLGLGLIRREKREPLRKRKIQLIIMVTIWFALALPIYKCEFYGIRHSFWESRDGHFH